MSMFRINLKPIVAAIIAVAGFCAPGHADEAALDQLFARLKTADVVDAARIGREIELEWSQSGSPSMDLLLKRGREAAEAKQYDAAIEHFTALTDHAPQFAEGWYELAKVYAQIGRIGPAVDALKRTLVLNPQQYDAIYGLGTIFEQIDEPDKAYDAYRLVLTLHPHHERAREGLQRVEGETNGTQL
ncbi:tetratricopeptide repeat protein [Aquicoccus sp. G2-2]|uniref:tetratricopeptide repeat protein n=1 Tax=Aquicoccus sp. G2-2 TaxID=3092120 RepID=UPI002ADF2D3C|nr:tetratricopeptide repeat protein [Aquicoccus sp. G2-2]MEA1114333.1 tetratricopeptide repeat protein [Aquicoccus sp. G2-2]